MNSKKGEFTLIEAVVLVISVVLVLALISFQNELHAAVFSGKDDGRMANFNRLSSTLGEVMSMGDTEKREFFYFLPKKTAFIAFDTAWDDTKDSFLIEDKTAYFDQDSNVYKPFSCGTSACICLYDVSSWKPWEGTERNQGVLECTSQPFAAKKVIFADKGQSTGQGALTFGLARNDGLGYHVGHSGNRWSASKSGGDLQVKKIILTKEQKGDITIIHFLVEEGNPTNP